MKERKFYEVNGRLFNDKESAERYEKVIQVGLKGIKDKLVNDIEDENIYLSSSFEELIKSIDVIDDLPGFLWSIESLQEWIGNNVEEYDGGISFCDSAYKDKEEYMKYISQCRVIEEDKEEDNLVKKKQYSPKKSSIITAEMYANHRKKNLEPLETRIEYQKKYWGYYGSL